MPYPKNPDEVNALFRGTADTIRPWKNSSSIPSSGLLMRVTDMSCRGICYPDMGNPEKDNGFLSKRPHEELGTYEERKHSLDLHLDWWSKDNTSWISTTGDVHDFRDRWIEHMLFRDKKRPSLCSVKLYFINVKARIEDGWPVMRAKEEMAFYEVLPKKRVMYAAYYENECVMPFKVPVSQIICTFCWTAATEYMEKNRCDIYRWHRAVVLPAFKEHEAARKEGRKVKDQSKYVCCGH